MKRPYDLSFCRILLLCSDDLKLWSSADRRSDISKNDPGFSNELGTFSIPCSAGNNSFRLSHKKKRPVGMNAAGRFILSGTRLCSFRYLPILSIFSFTVSFAVSLGLIHHTTSLFLRGVFSFDGFPRFSPFLLRRFLSLFFGFLCLSGKGVHHPRKRDTALYP